MSDGTTSEQGSKPDMAAEGAELLQGLLDVLDLEPQGTDEHGQDVFVGASQPQPHGRVFGGQVLGQALVAAGRTVEAGRRLAHSMHGYFLRAGDSASRSRSRSSGCATAGRSAPDGRTRCRAASRSCR